MIQLPRIMSMDFHRYRMLLQVTMCNILKNISYFHCKDKLQQKEVLHNLIHINHLQSKNQSSSQYQLCNNIQFHKGQHLPRLSKNLHRCWLQDYKIMKSIKYY